MRYGVVLASCIVVLAACIVVLAYAREDERLLRQNDILGFILCRTCFWFWLARCYLLFSRCHRSVYLWFSHTSSMPNQFDKYAIASDSNKAATMLHSGLPVLSIHEAVSVAHPARSAHHKAASVAQKDKHLGHLHTLPTADAIACGRPKCTPIVADIITAIAINTTLIFLFCFGTASGLACRDGDTQWGLAHESAAARLARRGRYRIDCRPCGDGYCRRGGRRRNGNGASAVERLRLGAATAAIAGYIRDDTLHANCGCVLPRAYLRHADQ